MNIMQEECHPELYKTNQRACELCESVCADVKQPEDSGSINFQKILNYTRRDND